jgi:hypothetical protein
MPSTPPLAAGGRGGGRVGTVQLFQQVLRGDAHLFLACSGVWLVPRAQLGQGHNQRVCTVRAKRLQSARARMSVAVLTAGGREWPHCATNVASLTPAHLLSTSLITAARPRSRGYPQALRRIRALPRQTSARRASRSPSAFTMPRACAPATAQKVRRLFYRSKRGSCTLRPARFAGKNPTR